VSEVKEVNRDPGILDCSTIGNQFMHTPNTIVGLGEILWDLLPAGKQLGGAPANFAYHAALLGNRGVVASRIGTDDLGTEILDLLMRLQLTTEHVQRDDDQPTGTVDVKLDEQGHPEYTIIEPVAWDALQWTDQWRQLAAATDAVCFGSLAQRHETSRTTIRNFLAATRDNAVRVFDINLRQHYYSDEILQYSLDIANIAKLNDDELPEVLRTLNLPATGMVDGAQRLLSLFELQLVCVTCGENGSLLITGTETQRAVGIHVNVADTVGAGDAFTAALCHHYLRGSDLGTMNNAANAMGAWVASQSGAPSNRTRSTTSDRRWRSVREGRSSHSTPLHTAPRTRKLFCRKAKSSLSISGS